MIQFRPLRSPGYTIVQVLVENLRSGKLETNGKEWSFVVQTRTVLEPWHLAAIRWQIGQLQMDLIEENVFESYKDFHDAMMGL